MKIKTYFSIIFCLKIKKCVFISSLSFFSFFSFFSLEATSWDLEYWSYLNWKNWESGPYLLYTKGEIRLNHDCSKIYHFEISENFAYQLNPYLDLEAHYSFHSSKSRGSSRFINTNRLELEVNPKMQLPSQVILKLRNRLQIAKKQHVSPLLFTLRHRFSALFPLQKHGRWKSICVYDELFYTFENNKFSENRFVPLEISFKLNEKKDLNLFFMIRNFLSSNRWYRSFALGSEFDF